ncbi:MAG: hypothetical protein A2Y10_06735 [Planctomycetes bacterium GWF2_41_51]|nr:MAG: hypothetical protein A2Y10_06735 [Planctomycetes bacterium GWF2_41_51]HBG29012.1 DUF86 domain-containing protein [Phycisphaerales bacterium]
MRPDERDSAYLWDMLDAAQMAEQLISGMDFVQYSNDRRTQLAVERSLEVVGEAAGRLSVDFRNAHSEIPWRQIIGQRNVLIHEYGEIKQERIYKVIKDNIPQLIGFLKKFVDFRS